MSHNYNLRNIPDPVHELINGSEAKPVVGRNSPRVEWLRTLTCIGALSFIDPDIAIASFELWQRALQIAKVQRDEEDLQGHETVKGKFIRQYADLEASYRQYQSRNVSFLDVINKLANILYYSVQDYVLTNNLRDFQACYQHACNLVGLPEAVAFQCAAAKYRDRAPRARKNKESEYQAMQQVLDLFEKSSENDLTNGTF